MLEYCVCVCVKEKQVYKHSNHIIETADKFFNSFAHQLSCSPFACVCVFVFVCCSRLLNHFSSILWSYTNRDIDFFPCSWFTINHSSTFTPFSYIHLLLNRSKTFLLSLYMYVNLYIYFLYITLTSEKTIDHFVSVRSFSNTKCTWVQL